MIQKQHVPANANDLAEGPETASDSAAFIPATRPKVQPLPTVGPRAKRTASAPTAERGFYFDPDNGTINAEQVPAAEPRPAPVQAPAYEWD
jgi:hypothetical protein